jgi:hypothetical protein
MRLDILGLLSGEKDVTNVIVLTHNIDFVFVQTIVLPALRRCGNSSLTIFADAKCAEESYQSQYLALDTLGSRFRVVPVAMHPGFCFHPKAILLSGAKKGTLLVGSGNLTFGGWRENGEVWSRFDSNIDGTSVFSAFRNYLDDILALVPLGHNIQSEIDEAFDGKTRDWASQMEAPGRLFYRAAKGENLLEQIGHEIGETRPDSIMVCSPYFDDQGEALRELSNKFGVSVQVLCQQRRSGLSREAAERISDIVSLSTFDFHHIKIDSGARQAFVHAKWYALITGESVRVFLGSANCSRAALTIPGSGGNAELMTVVDLSLTEFNEQFISELEFIDAAPELVSLSEVQSQEPNETSALRVLAARLEGSSLQVAYRSSSDVIVTKMIANNLSIEFSCVETGILLANTSESDLRSLQLEGIFNSNIVQSNSIWIDNEQALSVTARSRSVVDAIRRNVQSKAWNIGAWSEIADIFYRHLKYMPPRTSAPVRGDEHRDGNAVNAKQYTEHSVFSDGYGLPSFSVPIHGLAGQEEDRVTSLRQLLFRWFDLKEPVNTDNPVEPVNPDNPEPDGDDVVDTPEALPIRPKNPAEPSKPLQADVLEKERRRAREMVDLVTKELSSEEYLTQRSPEMLAIDIQFVAILLRTGLRENWVSQVEFFASTHRIWTAMFFSSSQTPSSGWLECRYKQAEDSDLFVEKLVSSKLSASLAAWAFAIPEQTQTPEHIRFMLAQILSVARLPWLWENSNVEDISHDLKELLSVSTAIDSDSFWKECETRWVKIMRQGHALRKLEASLSGKTPVMLKDSISEKNIHIGDVLWQGTSGYCVAKSNANRERSENVEILFLQKSPDFGKISAPFAIPIKALLAEPYMSDTDLATQILSEMLTVLKQ